MHSLTLQPQLAQRMELFIAGKEVANAYVELNDPAEQRRRFQQQTQVWVPEEQRHHDLPFAETSCSLHSFNP